MPGLNSWGLRWLGHHGRLRGAPAGQGAALGTAVFAAEPRIHGDVVGAPFSRGCARPSLDWVQAHCSVRHLLALPWLALGSQTSCNEKGGKIQPREGPGLETKKARCCDGGYGGRNTGAGPSPQAIDEPSRVLASRAALSGQWRRPMPCTGGRKAPAGSLQDMWRQAGALSPTLAMRGVYGRLFKGGFCSLCEEQSLGRLWSGVSRPRRARARHSRLISATPPLLRVRRISRPWGLGGKQSTAPLLSVEHNKSQQGSV